MAATAAILYSDRCDLALFDLQVTPMFPTKFHVNWPLGSTEVKYRFSRLPQWRPAWISDRNNLAIFDLQVTLMHPSKCPVNWPRGVGGVCMLLKQILDAARLTAYDDRQSST